jgi:hypothetical protein
MDARLAALRRYKRTGATLAYPPSMGRLRSHWPIAVVVAVGTAVRLAFWTALLPALTFPDSWTYVNTAYTGSVVGLSPDRPSGYPLILRVLSVPVRSLALVTLVQHVVGIGFGLGVYAFLTRLGVRRWLATAAAGIVLLDAYRIMLEQYILSEPFFALALGVALWLAVFHRRAWWGVAGSGVALFAAAIIHGNGFFLLPVWFAYVVATSRRRARVAVVAAGAFVVPLLLYAALHDGAGKGFAVTDADGWWLYGRVGAIVDCRHMHVASAARPLCVDSRGHSTNPGFYVWDAQSPAHIAFGGQMNQHNNAVLRSFSVAVVQARPLVYLRTVGGDLIRVVRPGGGGVDSSLMMPTKAGAQQLNRDATPFRLIWYPSYRAPWLASGSPLFFYERWLRTPRWALGLMAAGSLIIATVRRRSMRGRAEVWLLVGSAVAAMVMSVATVEMVFRYFVPLEPLLLSGAAIAAQAVLPVALPRTAGSRGHRGSARALRGRAGRLDA